ncbi:MAG: hypothetical protein ACRDBO_07595 [Lachnospiraceae bacterium]
MILFEKFKRVSEPEILSMFMGFHHRDNLFDSKKLAKRIVGYNWYVPKGILPYVFFDNGIMCINESAMNKENRNEEFEAWTCAFQTKYVFNIDMKYFRDKCYPIVFFGQKEYDCKFSWLIYIQLLLKIKNKINIVLSDDLNKYGIDNVSAIKLY